MIYDRMCPNETALANHIAALDAEERRNDAIEAETEKLLAGDYAPFLPENIAEGFGELDPQALVALSHLFQTGNLEAVGLVLKTHLNDYWQKSAERVATNEYDNP